MATGETIWGRWGVSERTAKNWTDRAGETGRDCPALAADPEEFLAWYREVMGREPSKKILARARELREAAGQAAEVGEVEIDRAPVAMIEAALERLGLARSLGRIIEEEEMAATAYEAARREGLSLEAPRRRWQSALEIKRQAQKNDDAVEVALDLLKEWVKTTWEPGERARRAALSGKELGRGARLALLATDTEAEWESAWDKAVDGALKDVERKAVEA